MTQALVPQDARTVDLHGDPTVVALIDEDGQRQLYAALRPMCERLDLDWKTQHSRVKADPVLGDAIRSVVLSTTEGYPREMVCLPLDYVHGWLFKINPARVAPDVRERLIAYQRDCYRVLAAAFGATPAPDLAARVAALEARLTPQTRIVYALPSRSPDALADAIIADLAGSAAPRSPSEVYRALSYGGWEGLTSRLLKVRLARLAQRGLVRKVARALYTAL